MSRSFPDTPLAAQEVRRQPQARAESGAASGRFVATDSPCVAVCSTLYDEICRGCGRTAMEVANWVFMSEAEKQSVWTRIKAQGYPRRKI